MSGWDSDFDDDMWTCPHCGHKEYPDVGMSFHHCPEGIAKSKAESDAFDKTYFGDRQKVRYTVLQVIECWDTDDSFKSAQDSLIWGNPRSDQRQSDEVLGYSIVQTIVKKENIP